MTISDQVNTPRIGEEQLELLERLSNACSVSGDEGEVRNIILEQVKPYADDIHIDALGNVIAAGRRSGKGQLRVMLAAHMDEVGFMLTHDEGDGIFRFDTVGGLDVRQLPGKPVWIGRDHIPGVIGARPIHLTKPDERRQVIKLDALRIDTGPENSGKAKVGDRAVFSTSFTNLGQSLRGKALDDRLGVATLIELLKHTPPNIDLQAAFTVQEEVGLRGARVAAYKIDPDIAIALDCTPANDLPPLEVGEIEENVRYNTRLGSGPAIYIADRVTLSDPRLVRHMIDTAEAESIPYQIRQPGGGGTDAGAIHKQREGIPSISVSTPGRYLHTAASIVRLEDWQNTLALLYSALIGLTPEIFSHKNNR